MIRIGLIGTGGMANAHANAFRNIDAAQVVACCDVVPERAEDFAKKWKIPSWYRTHREMFKREKLSAVSVITPDVHHAPICLDAIDAGLHVLCEKPLSDSLSSARKMVRALRRRKVTAMVNYMYRDLPGLQGMALHVGSGKIGKVYHVDAAYFQSWLISRSWGDWRKSPAWLWRLSSKHGSQGALGDLGSHLLDCLRMVAGEITEVSCRSRTFDKGVPDNKVDDFKLDANDSAVMGLGFENGAMGTAQVTRWAAGHLNTLRIAVYGDEGAVRFNLDHGGDSFECVRGQLHIDRSEWTKVPCKPVPSTFERFVHSITTGKPGQADFADGCRIQQLIHGCMNSDRKRGWVRTPKDR